MKIKIKKSSFRFSVVVLFCLLVINSIAVSKEYKVYDSYKLNSGTVNEYRLKNKIPVYINSEVQNQVAAVYIIPLLLYKKKDKKPKERKKSRHSQINKTERVHDL